MIRQCLETIEDEHKFEANSFVFQSAVSGKAKLLPNGVGHAQTPR